MPTALIASAVAATAVLPLGWAAGASFVVEWREAAWLACCGIVTMAVALPCYLVGAADVPAGRAMLISAMEMPLAPLWVWLALGELPSAASLVGGLIVTAAILSDLVGKAAPVDRPKRLRPVSGLIRLESAMAYGSAVPSILSSG